MNLDYGFSLLNTPEQAVELLRTANLPDESTAAGSLSTWSLLSCTLRS